MALIRCYECGQEMSDQASSCPTCGAPKKYRTGDTGPAGGIMLVEGSTRLEVAPASSEFAATWYEAKERCAEMRIGGVGGWRLPSKEELHAMYINLKTKGLGNFEDECYWSSSEYDVYTAWGQRFSDGYQSNGFKIGTFCVRGVRAF